MHTTSYLTYSISIKENVEETFIFPHFLQETLEVTNVNKPFCLSCVISLFF